MVVEHTDVCLDCLCGLTMAMLPAAADNMLYFAGKCSQYFAIGYLAVTR